MAEDKLIAKIELTEEIMRNAFERTEIAGHSLKDWIRILASNKVDGAWVCDPEKATGCKKTACGKTGGECWLTTHEVWRVDPPKAEGWTVLAVTDGEIYQVEQVSELRIRGADGLQMHRLDDDTITIAKPIK